MTYMNMTFCRSHSCKNNCNRKLTQEVIDAGNLWWNSWNTEEKKNKCRFSTSNFCGSDGEVL